MPTEKKIICGVKEPTKNERRGTMKECAEKKQIRFWGVKKVDKIMINKMTIGKGKNKEDDKNLSKNVIIGRARGFETRGKKIKIAIAEAEKEKDKKKIKKLTEEYDKVRKEYVKYAKMANKLLGIK